MKWVEIEFQGQRHRVPVLKHQGRLWWHWLGETHVLDLESDAGGKSGERAALKPGQIAAPMPGKITRVNVKVGDGVMRGQVLVVMEAMKMEYTLEADRDGIAKTVNAQAGQQVSLGQLLVKVEDK